MRYLADKGFVDQDGELVFMGPAAELAIGRRHFMAMTAAFTAPPQFTVFAGRDEIGRTDPMLLTEKVTGPRLILLAGRSSKVNWVGRSLSGRRAGSSGLALCGHRRSARLQDGRR